MAQGQRNNGNHPLANLSPEDWGRACAAAGFATTPEGAALIGVSGDEGDVGYIVPVPAPTQIDMNNLVRALLSHALRVGQQGVKASKEPSREVATEAAQSAVNGGYKPSRERDNNILDREADKMLRAHVAALVKQAKPDATDEDIEVTLNAQRETERGKQLLTEFKNTLMQNGTYTVPRRNKGKGKATQVAITL